MQSPEWYYRCERLSFPLTWRVLWCLSAQRGSSPRGKKKKLLGRKERLLLFLFAIRGLSEEEKPHKNQLLNDTVYAPP